MKLIYLCQYFSFPDCPGGTRAYDLSTSFVRAGIDVTIVTTNGSIPQLRNQTKRWEYIERDGLKLYIHNNPYEQKMSFRRRMRSFISFAYNASSKLKHIECDLLLATSTPLTVGIPALVKKTFSKTPYIFEIRDVWPEVPIKMGVLKNRFVNNMLRSLEKKIYKRASALVPLSVGMEHNIRSRINLGDKKVVVIPNIAEISRFSNLTKDPQVLYPFDLKDKKIILYCGTSGRVNGVDFMVNLAAKTQNIDSSIIYCIFGGGNQLDSVLEKAKNAGVFNKVLFYGGKVPKQDLPSLYHAATMGSSFVIDIPVLWDNSANKFFDTLAAGRPMLINHEGWQADVIREMQCGYVLPTNITDSIAKDFVNYMNDSSKIEEAGKNAYQLATERYSLEIAITKYLEIFNSVLSSH